MTEAKKSWGGGDMWIVIGFSVDGLMLDRLTWTKGAFVIGIKSRVSLRQGYSRVAPESVTQLGSQRVN